MAYPPPGGGYPPAQGGFNLDPFAAQYGGAYPPQQQQYPGYPPQQQYPGYPPQQQYPGYPPQQQYPGYPPAAGYPAGPAYPAAPGYGAAPGYSAPGYGAPAQNYVAAKNMKKDKKDKKDKKEKKKKMTKEEKKRAKQAKNKKKATNKSQVANYARPPDQALISKIQASEARPAGPGGAPNPKTPAEQWGSSGKAEGLEIWRIENFKVIPWPRPNYGQFFNGDSYIVLNTYKRGNAFRWDIHFWLGEKTTQDEAGTAAYKTVELDNYLGGTPVQHREVQDFESDLFLSYFKPTIQILQGGVESGFNQVRPTEYEPRLLHLKGKRRVRVTQTSLSSDSLNSGDVFVLDGGLTVYQWNGKESSPQERTKGGEVARAIRDGRKGQPNVITIEEGREDANFWQALGGRGPIASADEGGDDFDAERVGGTKALLRLSDATGQLQINQVAQGKVTRNQFQSADVFIFDTGYEIFAWIGKGASVQEKNRAMAHAQDYLARAGKPAYLPVTRVMEGCENESFVAALDR